MKATSQILFEQNGIQATLISQASSTLIITFNAHGDIGFNRPGFGENFLLKNSFDVLVFKTQENDWYQTIKTEQLAFIGELIGKKYQKILGYSISMGAYALLYFSEVLRIPQIIAFCPQYSIDRKICPFETRWEQEVNTIDFQHTWDNKIFDTKVQFIYDPYAYFDQQHIDRFLPHFPNHEIIKLNFLGHPTVGGLLESKQLSVLIFSLLNESTNQRINESTIDWHNIRKNIKQRSINVYFVELLYYSLFNNLTRAKIIYDYFKNIHAPASFETAVLIILNRIIDNGHYDAGYALLIFHIQSCYLPNLNIEKINFLYLNFILQNIPIELKDIFIKILKSFKMYGFEDNSLKHQNGLLQNNRLYSEASVGILSYGPYISLPASSFKVFIRGETRKIPTIFITKITLEGGKILISETYHTITTLGKFFIEQDIIIPCQSNNFECVIILPIPNEVIIDTLTLSLSELLLNKSPQNLV